MPMASLFDQLLSLLLSSISCLVSWICASTVELLSKMTYLPFYGSVSIYQGTVLSFGDFDKFDLQGWTTWAEPGVTALVALIAHVFYIRRCWSVTRSLPIVIFLALGWCLHTWIFDQSFMTLFIVALLAFASGVMYVDLDLLALSSVPN
jgi:hypothetical protein